MAGTFGNGDRHSLHRLQHLHRHIELRIPLPVREPLSAPIFHQYRSPLIDSVDDVLVFYAIESESYGHSRFDAEFDNRLFSGRD